MKLLQTTFILLLSLILLATSQRMFIGGRFDSSADPSQTSLSSLAIYDADYDLWIKISTGATLSQTTTRNATVYTSLYDTSANKIYIAGDFDTIGTATGANVAVISLSGTVQDYSDVSFIVNDMDGVAKVMVLHSGYLYVGGDFGSVNGVQTGALARMDVSSGSWEGFGNVSGVVRALEVSDGVLYVGGDMGLVGIDVGTMNDVVLDGMVCGGAVYAIEVVGSDVYVGGSVGSIVNGTDCTGAVASRALVRYVSGVGIFDDVVKGSISGHVFDLHSIDMSLFAGGNFTYTTTGGVKIYSVANVSRDGWTRISNQNLDYPFSVADSVSIKTLDSFGDILAIGGEIIHNTFTSTSHRSVSYVSFDTLIWYPMDQGLSCQVCEAQAADVYTISILPSGDVPEDYTSDQTTTVPDLQSGLDGLGIPPFPGMEIFFGGNGTVNSSWLGADDDLVLIAVWGIVLGGSLVAALLMACFVNGCFYCCTRIRVLGDDSLSDSV